MSVVHPVISERMRERLLRISEQRAADAEALVRLFVKMDAEGKRGGTFDLRTGTFVD